VASSCAERARAGEAPVFNRVPSGQWRRAKAVLMGGKHSGTRKLSDKSLKRGVTRALEAGNKRDLKKKGKQPAIQKWMASLILLREKKRPAMGW